MLEDGIPTRTRHACTWYEIYIRRKQRNSGRFRNNNIFVGNYWLRRAERWEKIRSLARKNGLELQADVVRRWSNILGANRRLAHAKSSMLQENKRDVLFLYVL